MPSIYFLLLSYYLHTLFQNTCTSLLLKTCIASSNGSSTNILLLMHTEFFFLLGILKSMLCLGLCREMVAHSVQLFCFRLKISKKVSLSSLISAFHHDFTLQLKAFYLQESECPWRTKEQFTLMIRRKVITHLWI